MARRSSECSWREIILRCRFRQIASLVRHGAARAPSHPAWDNELRVALLRKQTLQTWRAKPKMDGNCRPLDPIGGWWARHFEGRSPCKLPRQLFMALDV
jgi:hypothetical protein